MILYFIVAYHTQVSVYDTCLLCCSTNVRLFIETNYTNRRVHKTRQIRKQKQYRRDKETDNAQRRRPHQPHTAANPQRTHRDHGTSTTNTTATGIQPTHGTTPISPGGVYETIPVQQSEASSVYARVHQPVYFTSLDRPVESTVPPEYARVDGSVVAPSETYVRLDRPTDAASPSVFYARLGSQT